MTDTTRYENTRDALRLAPDLIEHMVALIPMKSKPGPDDDVRTKRPVPPMPLNEGAFNDSNELYGRLAYWAHYWGNALSVQAPGPARRAWRTDSTVAGFPSSSDAAAVRYDVGIMATLLLIHLDEIFRRPPDDVAYFATEIADWHRAAARYPVNAQPRWTALWAHIGSVDWAVVGSAVIGSVLATFTPNKSGYNPGTAPTPEMDADSPVVVKA